MLRFDPSRFSPLFAVLDICDLELQNPHEDVIFASELLMGFISFDI